MKLPRVNPVGIVEVPSEYEAQPRQFSAAWRWASMTILVAFVLAMLVTTVASLGRYCLTSDGGNVQNLSLSSEKGAL